MADKIKILTAVSAAVIAVSACVSLIIGNSSENSVIIVNDRSNAVEYSETEQATTSVSTKSSVKIPKTTTTTTVTSTSRTTVSTTVRTTSLKSTEVPIISCETEAADYEEEILFIDINTAEKEELTKLKGIGEYLANEIISYRDEYGGFNNIEEIMNVNGIGEKIFAEIAEFIYVENPVYSSDEEVSEEIVPDEPEPETICEDIPQETEITLESCIPININTADREILMLLPNVTEETADEIIELRSSLGGFSHVYELIYLKSLSQNQIAEITDYLTI